MFLPRHASEPAAGRRPARRWRGSAAAAALIGALLSGAACGAGTPGPERPNVLLISIDTLRPARLGCYGNERDTSPTLDRLASEGVVFEDVTSASPWTLPSHASLLTGRYPSHHGVRDHTNRLSTSVPTLASHFAAAGYATAAVVNSHNVSERYGLGQGFEHFQYVLEYLEDGSLPNRGRQVLRRARNLLAKSAGRPFFLFLHFYDVHTDFVVAPDYRARFVRPYSGALNGTTAQLLEVRDSGRALDEADVRFLFDMYDAEIRQLDDLLAGFLTELENEGRLSSTLVAVVSDHGEEFMEHGSVLHGRTYYQEIVKIPWILRGPGVRAGLRVAAPVHLVDVAPTLLALAGLESAAEGMDGLSLAALARGEGGALPERLLFAEADHNNSEPDIRRLVRSPRYKLLYDRLLDRASLFDLQDDPGERRDLWEAEPDLGALLLERLRAFMEGATAGESIEAPSDDVLQRLQQLGY